MSWVPEFLLLELSSELLHPLSGHDDSSSEIHIFRMLQILREFSTDPILCVYVIDDVWEYMKAMKDWKCIISMLLDQNPRTGSTTDEDSTNLIRLLFVSIRKAVGEKIIPSTDNRKQYHSKAQRVRLSLLFLRKSHVVTMI
jgi:cohesin complex subunit SA-1/2